MKKETKGVVQMCAAPFCTRVRKMDKTMSIRSLKGVGDKTALLFEKLNIYTLNDLIHFYPRNYLMYEEPVAVEDISIGQRCALEVMVSAPALIKKINGRTRIICKMADMTGSIECIWYQMPFMKNILKTGQTFVLVGVPKWKNYHMVMEQPEYYTYDKYQEMRQCMQPVYPLTKGLNNNLVKKMMHQVEELIQKEEDYLPETMREKYQCMPLAQAMMQVHFPQGKETLIAAKSRLVFDEFLQFFIQMYLLKEAEEMMPNQFPVNGCEECQDLVKRLPYHLTSAQIRTIEEIKKDVSGPFVMSRLIQGDVGSGKTIIAVFAMLMTVCAGYQAAFMVPTEVLAKQQFESIQALLSRYGVRCCMLTGSLKAYEKRRLYEEIREHQVDIIIGTHAMIQENVHYEDLGMVITDEQHRFGVRQREALANKGRMPHVLIMSATPIPRTLAMMLYGDMSISIVDELPANRLPIKNCVIESKQRETAIRFLDKEVASGRQAYVICPMVEENEEMDAENVVEYTQMMKQRLPHRRIESLHGQMKASEKSSIMERFSQGEIEILVSTTVIEVGINVPNATVMVIENAERFGLAQLHQLRGRVGRGKWQSYCIFIQGNKSKEARERLEVVNHSNDGFHIANEDLRLRGPGDFFGVRQSGDMNFVLADIYAHVDTMQKANDCLNDMLGMNCDIRQISSNLNNYFTI
ncbi:MAG: ATP-dependent DNA helicase RecG [Lachnospiraceae bacterium]